MAGALLVDEGVPALVHGRAEHGKYADVDAGTWLDSRADLVHLFAFILLFTAAQFALPLALFGRGAIRKARLLFWLGLAVFTVASLLSLHHLQHDWNVVPYGNLLSYYGLFERNYLLGTRPTSAPYWVFLAFTLLTFLAWGLFAWELTPPKRRVAGEMGGLPEPDTGGPVRNGKRTLDGRDLGNCVRPLLRDLYLGDLGASCRNDLLRQISDSTFAGHSYRLPLSDAEAAGGKQRAGASSCGGLQPGAGFRRVRHPDQA